MVKPRVVWSLTRGYTNEKLKKNGHLRRWSRSLGGWSCFELVINNGTWSLTRGGRILSLNSAGLQPPGFFFAPVFYLTNNQINLSKVIYLASVIDKQF